MSEFRNTRLFTVVGNDTLANRTVFSGSGILSTVNVSVTVDDTVEFQDEDGTTLFTLVALATGDNAPSWCPEVVLDNGLVVAVTLSTTFINVAWRPQ